MLLSTGVGNEQPTTAETKDLTAVDLTAVNKRMAVASQLTSLAYA